MAEKPTKQDRSQMLPTQDVKFGHSEYDRNQYSQYEYLGMQVDAPEPQPIDFSMPFLEQWKTSPIATAVGILLAAALCGSCTLVGAIAQEPGMTAVFIASCVVMALYTGAAMLWAVVFYPKLYSNAPLDLSNAQASFANGFFGGLVFGLLWNHSMTQRKAGVSHIIFGILVALPFAQNLLDIFQTLPY